MTAFDATFRDALRDLIVWRRDVRRFRRDALPPGTIERLLQLASLAPSVGLSQPWRFVVVEDAARRAAVRDNFHRCNEAALAAYAGARARRYATLKLAGLDEVAAVLVDGTTLYAQVAHSASALPSLLAALDRAGLAVAQVALSRPSLDDVYLDATGHAYRSEGAGNGDRSGGAW